MAITGHQTEQMVKLYTKRIEQKRLATSAVRNSSAEGVDHEDWETPRPTRETHVNTRGTDERMIWIIVKFHRVRSYGGCRRTRTFDPLI
jgi:hypothetical protein